MSGILICMCIYRCLQTDRHLEACAELMAAVYLIVVNTEALKALILVNSGCYNKIP